MNRLILKIGGFTPVLANHKKWIFPLKRAFLDERQWPVRRLSNQISSFRLETRLSLLTYGLLTFMLHYKIHGFLLKELSVRQTFQSYIFHLREQQWKTQHFASVWKAVLAPFTPSNYVPDVSQKAVSMLKIKTLRHCGNLLKVSNEIKKLCKKYHC